MTLTFVAAYCILWADINDCKSTYIYTNKYLRQLGICKRK